jgi:hypothetical protein
LTASEQLTVLVLDCSAKSGVPERAWQHVLPRGKQLLELQVLELRPARWVHHSTVSAAAARRWVQCCPGLWQLTLSGVDDSVVFESLLPLQASLKHLRLSGEGCDDVAAAPVGQLTGLETLEWLGGGTEGSVTRSKLTSAGVANLTTLQGLSRLVIQIVLPFSYWVAPKLAAATDSSMSVLWVSGSPLALKDMCLQVMLLASEVGCAPFWFEFSPRHGLFE